jgi:hypothetical protein
MENSKGNSVQVKEPTFLSDTSIHFRALSSKEREFTLKELKSAKKMLEDYCVNGKNIEKSR